MTFQSKVFRILILFFSLLFWYVYLFFTLTKDTGNELLLIGCLLPVIFSRYIGSSSHYYSSIISIGTGVFFISLMIFSPIFFYAHGGSFEYALLSCLLISVPLTYIYSKTYIQRAKRMIRTSQYIHAHYYLVEHEKVFGKSSESLYLLGINYFYRHRFSTSIKFLSKCTGTRAKDARYYIFLNFIAKKLYKKALQFEKANAQEIGYKNEAQIVKAFVFEELGKQEKAKALYSSLTSDNLRQDFATKYLNILNKENIERESDAIQWKMTTLYRLNLNKSLKSLSIKILKHTKDELLISICKAFLKKIEVDEKYNK